jgi:hypothetical protein
MCNLPATLSNPPITWNGNSNISFFPISLFDDIAIVVS